MYRHIGILFSILVLAKCQDTNPTVCLDQGACYKGSWLRTNLENTYGSFQGIQYAESPVGSLRFKAPQPFLASEAVFDVSHESKIICPQPQAFPVGLIGQEDCLVLNVYVPEKALNNPDVKLPVMVWIHGGGLVSLKLEIYHVLRILVVSNEKRQFSYVWKGQQEFLLCCTLPVITN